MRIFNSNWSLNRVKRGVSSSINPSGGYKISSDISLESNDFIEGLNFSDAGTLTEEFKSYDMARIHMNSSYYYGLPFFKHWTLSLNGALGWISKDNVDSFFYFYLGGFPGIKGYSFYSIQGTKKLFLEATLRMPLFMSKNYNFKWMTFQNSTVGLITQIGDAWENDDLLFKNHLEFNCALMYFLFITSLLQLS